MTDTIAPAADLRTREEYLAAVDQVRTAAAAYYATSDDDPVLLMDDGTYDTLTRGIAAAEDAHPEWTVANSPTTTVAAGAAATGNAKHAVPMLSLDNLFTDEEVDEWLTSRERLLGRPIAMFVVEPKYDGNACSARYENGRLVRIATRGDGLTGEDRTYAIDRIANLPRTLTEPFTGEIRGEVMFRAADYEAASAARVAAGKSPYVNERNGGAGAFGAETLAYPVRLTFFPYGIAGAAGLTSHRDSLRFITRLGFDDVAGNLVSACGSPAAVKKAIQALSDARADLDFRIDGAVIKVDAIAEQEQLGLASRAPRWGTAFKYPPDTAISTLEEVIWQVGRTGVITPRARVVPVFVGGTTISYATLHNPDDMARKGFMLYDKVTVMRAGEVIPRLEAPVVNLRDGSQIPIAVPQTCPNCGAEIDKSQVRWRCSRGRYCVLAESLEYAAKRDAWYIKGLGDKIIAQLVERELVGDVGDLFTLTRADLASLDRSGEATADNILEQLEAAKAKPLSRTLTALGIRGTGRSLSRRIARHFKTMEAVRAATVAEMEEVDGLGKEKAPSVVAELAELAEVIDKLIAAGLTMTEDEDVATGASEAGETGATGETAAKPLAGMTVVATGSMSGPLAALSRNEVNELIERAGGKSSGSVSAKTSILVAGEKAGGKLAKAETLNSSGASIEILTPEEFAERVIAYLR